MIFFIDEENKNDFLTKIIELMAEDLTTDYHSKEWVIEYYTKKAEEKMNEEEKKAIEYFDYQIELAKKEIEKYKEDEFKGNGTLEDIAKMQYCNLVKIKNLLDKLQKENEQLKEENFDQVYMKAIADYKEKIRKIKKRLENGDSRCYPGDDGTEYAICIINKILEEENE